MRTAIISDIHSNLEALKAALLDIGTLNVDRIICLGDLVGYNASPMECIQMLRMHDVQCVAGNHDRAVTQQIALSDFGYTAEKAIAWTRRRLDADALEYLSALPTDLTIPDTLVAVHGALHPNTARETVRLDTDERRRLSLEALSKHASGVHICAFGHTHQLGIFELRGHVVRKLTGDRISLRQNSWYLINPGTIGQPRSSDVRATYLVLDTAESELTVHRVAYDASLTFAMTRKAGLVPLWKALPRPLVDMMMRIPEPYRRGLRKGIRAIRL